MTRKILTILVLLAAAYGVYFLINYYRDFESSPQVQSASTAPVAPVVEGDPNIPSESLAGLPARFEASLKGAYAQGATGLASWLRANRRYVGDPRLAAIELDYAALLARIDPAGAKVIFNSVRRRTPENSPLYARVKKLEVVYQ